MKRIGKKWVVGTGTASLVAMVGAGGMIVSVLRDARGVSIALGVLVVAAMITLLFFFASLYARLKRLEAMTDLVLSGVMVMRRDGTIKHANDTFCALVGVSRAEIEGGLVSGRSLTHPGAIAALRQAAEELKKHGRCQPFEIELRRRDGTNVPVLATAVHMNNGDIGAIIQDLSTIRAAEKALKDAASESLRARGEAERASEMKSRFLANVSHEIRTPLNAIMGYSELLKEAVNWASHRAEYLETILRNGRSLARLIDDVLDLSKVEAGRLEFRQETVDLDVLLAETVASVSRSAKAKPVEVRFDNRSGLKTIVTDGHRLRQILLNVTGNAVKFTDIGEVTIVATTLAGDGDRPAELQISVTDTGVGMDRSQSDRLFRPFSQVDSSLTRRHGGTGLGLDLSRRLARMLGGELRLGSTTLGAGSEFVLTLPIRLADSPSTQGPSESMGTPLALPTITGKPLYGMRVLIAEDYLDNQNFLARVLRVAGATTLVASNGREATELAITDAPDVILMDIQMPLVDGYEATRDLRARGLRTPIVAVSAHASAEDRERSLSAGMNGHLTKPLTPRLVVDEILRVMGRVTPDAADRGATATAGEA